MPEGFDSQMSSRWHTVPDLQIGVSDFSNLRARTFACWLALLDRVAGNRFSYMNSSANFGQYGTFLELLQFYNQCNAIRNKLFGENLVATSVECFAPVLTESNPILYYTLWVTRLFRVSLQKTTKMIGSSQIMSQMIWNASR